MGNRCTSDIFAAPDRKATNAAPATRSEIRPVYVRLSHDCHSSNIGALPLQEYLVAVLTPPPPIENMFIFFLAHEEARQSNLPMFTREVCKGKGNPSLLCLMLAYFIMNQPFKVIGSFECKSMHPIIQLGIWVNAKGSNNPNLVHASEFMAVCTKPHFSPSWINFWKKCKQ